MELRDARKINSKELYDRRKQAVLLFEKGLKRYEIAPLVGVSAYTVGQWIKAWKKGGQAALKVGNKGRPRGLIQEGDKSYTYAWLDKLMSVSEAGKVSANFSYHLNGQIASVIYADGRRENYLWDGLALIHRDGTELLNEPAITDGNPVLSGNKVLFNDLLGNTLGVKDQSSYQPIKMTAFGESDNVDAFFTGKPLVGELGYAFLFRNYRPEQGKWQTADPLGYPDGWNNFAYVNNLPLCYIDIYGCVSWSTLAQGALGVLGGSVEVVASVALVANPTAPGVSQTLGVIGFMDGLGRIGLGIANITNGILDNEAGPADYIEVTAMIAGQFNPESQETYDSIATAVNLGLGLYLPGAQSKIIENGMKIFDGYTAIEVIIDSLKKIHQQLE